MIGILKKIFSWFSRSSSQDDTAVKSPKGKEIESMTKSNDNIEQNIKKILDSQEKLFTMVQRLEENSMSQLKSEQESNKDQLEKLRAERDDALKKVKEKENDLKAANATHEETKKALKDAKLTKEQTENDLKAANTAKEQTENDLKAANTAKEQTENDLKAANATLDETKKALEAANTAKEQTENDLKAASATLDETKKALEAANATIAEREKALKTAESEFLALKTEYDILKKAHDEEQKIRQPYSEAFKLFQELPPEMRENMRGILRGENVNQFIFVGMQEENIGRLWDFCANEAKKKSEHTEKLSKIFWFLFEKCQQQLHDTPIYEKAAIAVGDKFDEDFSTRDGDSAPLGKISKIWLYGYNRCIGNKVVKKSIVHVDKD